MRTFLGSKKMDHGKYIIVENMGSETPIMFPSFVTHNIVAENMNKKVVSAGFFEVSTNSTENNKRDISVYVFGESTTLKLKTREKDNFLIKKVLKNSTY